MNYFLYTIEGIFKKLIFIQNFVWFFAEKFIAETNMFISK